MPFEPFYSVLSACSALFPLALGSPIRLPHLPRPRNELDLRLALDCLVRGPIGEVTDRPDVEVEGRGERRAGSVASTVADGVGYWPRGGKRSDGG
jgi:hypothetical protein